MTYYPKVTNTDTGKSMVMTFPTFTKKRTALEWANEFMKVQNNAKVVIIGEHEK